MLFGHVAGMPVEETLMAAPGLVAAGGAWIATVRARTAARRNRGQASPSAAPVQQPPDAVREHLEEQP
jgi:hypothetical protein